MPPAQKGSGAAKGRSRGTRGTRYSGETSRYLGKDDPKWTTNVTFKPPKKISDAMRKYGDWLETTLTKLKGAKESLTEVLQGITPEQRAALPSEIKIATVQLEAVNLVIARPEVDAKTSSSTP